jgi:hypothetical protein
VRAVEVAIAAGDLPDTARSYRKTDLLEVLSEAMGLARNALRNLYYRDEGRLEIVLQGYIAQNPDEVSRGIKDLKFRQFSPVVWKRPAAQLKQSRRTLPSTLVLLQGAEKSLKDSQEPTIEFRREIGTVAAEIMACALTFYDGRQRWDLLHEGERIFKAAMGSVMLELDITPEDAALFARFWENRATVCGLEWSNIWDDPATPPTVSNEIVELALRELDRAAQWTQQHLSAGADDGQRLRQLLADKAKWLAKVGRFDEAWALLERSGDRESRAARSDALLLSTLEHIANGRLPQAASTAGALAELSAQPDEPSPLAAVTSSILVHHVELLRDHLLPPDPAIEAFLRDSPVVASEMVNLPRYKERLVNLGYLGRD